MSTPKDTTALDQFYLEWSQFTGALNQREARAATLLIHLIHDLPDYHDEDKEELRSRLLEIRSTLIDR